MKNLKKLVKTWVMITLAFYSLTFISCKGKEGDIGPAGADGIIGADGADGSAVSAADQSAYNSADGLVGGRLYDNFMDQLGSTDTSLTNNADFFRCKQCHGWDLRGSFGAYIDRAPSATRPAVAANDLYVYAQTRNIREIFDAVKHTGGRNKMGSANERSLNGSMPDYGLILTTDQIWQLTKFLKAEAFNTFNLYDLTTTGYYPTGTKIFTNSGKNGDAVNGNDMFADDCAACHGADGTALALDDNSAYMGDMTRNNPAEFQHKARFGHAGSIMPTFSDNTESVVKDLLKAIQDTTNFPGF